MKNVLPSTAENPQTVAAALPAGPVTLTVLFADVSGSTKLYDALGDTQAKAMVDECIGIMRAVVAKYGGRVIKTIGDEVMCVLPQADTGLLAATDMQTKVSALPAATSSFLSSRSMSAMSARVRCWEASTSISTSIARRRCTA